MADSVSATIKVDLSALKDAPRDRLHLIPAEIKCDGEAKVDQYFTPAVQEGDSEKLASYRGRAVRGQEVAVPPGYVGLVLKEDHRPCSEEEDRTVRIKSAFSSLTYWNLETSPTADDSVVMAMTWAQIAEAIHAPVEDE